MISRIKIAQTDYFTVVCSVARSPANFSKASETVFLPIKPKQSLKPYDYRAVYTHIPNMNRSSSSLLVQEVSSVYHFSVFRHRRLKMALRARKLSGAFEKRMEARLDVTLFWCRTLCFCCVKQVVLMLTRCIYMTKQRGLYVSKQGHLQHRCH